MAEMIADIATNEVSFKMVKAWLDLCDWPEAIAVIGPRESLWEERHVRKVLMSLCLLNKDITIISGGAKGVDTWADTHAQKLGIMTIIIRPNYKPNLTYYEVVKRIYARNESIAQNCDACIAFVKAVRKGGTEHTIKMCGKYKKPVLIFHP